jgi:hypothetical protein
MSSTCSICLSDIIDKVYLTCSAKHPFCFRCLIQSIEVTNELKNCPLCKGGDKFIMVDMSKLEDNNNFYSLSYFKKSIPFLKKILNDNIGSNSCLVSEQVLITYVNNKKQLSVAHKLLDSSYEINEIISLIRWDEKGVYTDKFSNHVNTFATDLMDGIASSFLNNQGTFFTIPQSQMPSSFIPTYFAQQSQRR